MAITYPLDLPSSIGMASVSLRATNAVAISQSPFTFSQQVQSYAGQMWAADITLPTTRRDLIEPWLAFLISLKGHYGTFLLGDPNASTPQGSASSNPGSPVLDSASSDRSTLTVSGLPVSETGYLKAGDYIQLGSSVSATLHKVLVDVDSDGSGESSIEIWPAMRRDVSPGESVTVSDAKGLFRLAGNTTNYSINPSSIYEVQFSAMEVV